MSVGERDRKGRREGEEGKKEKGKKGRKKGKGSSRGRGVCESARNELRRVGLFRAHPSRSEVAPAGTRFFYPQKDAPQHVDISMQNRSFWRPRGPELCPAPCRRVPNLDKCPRGHLAKFRKIEVGMWKGRWGLVKGTSLECMHCIWSDSILGFDKCEHPPIHTWTTLFTPRPQV